MAKSRKRTDSSVPDQGSSFEQQDNNGNGGPTHDRDRVAQRAYELYLARGGEHGSDWDDWLAAERELMTAPQGGGEQRRGAQGRGEQGRGEQGRGEQGRGEQGSGERGRGDEDR